MPLHLFTLPTRDTLVARKDVRGLVNLMLKSFPGAESQAAFKALNDLGWQPGDDAAGAVAALYCNDFARVVSIGTPAVGPLVDLLRSWTVKDNELCPVYGVDEQGELSGVTYELRDTTRRDARDALTRIGPTVVPALVKLICREDATRLAAALEPVMSVLIDSGDPRAMDGLLHLLRQYPNSFEFWRQFRIAMQKFKDRRAIPYLRRACRDPHLDGFMRGDAMNTLKDLGEKW
ncbi:MAG TPA: hypothetical protein PKG95_01235 [Anaerolineaceae bacterium]|nr:hypothetical protein [Anaerolineaceae bacterium]